MCTWFPVCNGRRLDDQGLVPREKEPTQDLGREGDDKVWPLSLRATENSADPSLSHRGRSADFSVPFMEAVDRYMYV